MRASNLSTRLLNNFLYLLRNVDFILLFCRINPFPLYGYLLYLKGSNHFYWHLRYTALAAVFWRTVSTRKPPHHSWYWSWNCQSWKQLEFFFSPRDFSIRCHLLSCCNIFFSVIWELSVLIYYWNGSENWHGCRHTTGTKYQSVAHTNTDITFVALPFMRLTSKNQVWVCRNKCCH